MSEIAVQFLMQKYDMDEATAKGIVEFYKLFNGDQTAPPSTVGVLTPEELLELQRRQQALTTGALTPTPERIQVSVPQSFGAGGAVPGGPAQTPAEREPNPVNPWWYLIGAWNFITDPIWIYMFLRNTAGQTVGPATQAIARVSPLGIGQRGVRFIRSTGTAQAPPLTTGAGVSIGGQPVQARPGIFSRAASRIRGTLPSRAAPTVGTVTRPTAGIFSSQAARALGGGLVSGLAAAGTVQTFQTLAEAAGAPFAGGGEGAWPEPLESAIPGICPPDYVWYNQWSMPGVPQFGQLRAGCYTRSQSTSINREINRLEAGTALGMGPSG